MKALICTLSLCLHIQAYSEEEQLLISAAVLRQMFSNLTF
jgi:hypothetical protein